MGEDIDNVYTMSYNVQRNIFILMKRVEWNKAKNEWLKLVREIDFDRVMTGRVLRVSPHPNKKVYPNQKIMTILFEGYVYLVPFVEDSKKIFLKTIIPSRKATRDYMISIK